MAGQQQLNTITKKSLFKEHKSVIMRSADSYYLEQKFAIKKGYNELKTIHSYLLQDTLSNNTCEISDFFNKKLRGALGEENIAVVDLKTMQTKYRDINNYYTQAFEWESEIKW